MTQIIDAFKNVLRVINNCFLMYFTGGYSTMYNILFAQINEIQPVLFNKKMHITSHIYAVYRPKNKLKNIIFDI